MGYQNSCLPSFRLNSDPSQLSGWKKIFQTEESRKVPKKVIIVEQGQEVNYLYYIQKGMVEYTYIREDGSQELLEILGEGSIFGLQPIFGKNPAVGSFITLNDTLLNVIRVDKLNAYMDRDPRLTKELLVELSKITGGLIRQLNERTLSAERRIEELIYLLAEYSNREEAATGNIHISLSQDDIARITRTTRVTVTKAVGELKKQRLIDTCYGGIIVRDFSGLGNTLSKL